MIRSPLMLEPLFHVGTVPVTAPVLVASAIVLSLGAGARLASRRFALRPSRLQATIELFVAAVDEQIKGV
ncbi:MAG TPA: F0F1 ATP synthase subunit A, partial [Rhodoblastus sp.]|nr:F0F1 ATP synthase subunit A [Rhodoblastus sp.]